MQTLYADFNARSERDHVWLDSVGSRESLARTQLGRGDWVWLSDGEIRVGAQLVDEDGHLVAEPAWDSVEEIIPEGDERRGPEAIRVALSELREALGINSPRILRLLPVVESVLPRSGEAEYYRSRALDTLGHPQLALGAVEEAVDKARDHVPFQHQRLYLLRKVDPDAALQEALAAMDDPTLPASLVEAHAHSLMDDAAQLAGDACSARLRQLIELTDRFEPMPDRGTVPSSVSTSVYQMRGYAFSHLGDRERASKEFTRAIRSVPSDQEAAWIYGARGMENYPDDDAVADLRRSVDLGATHFLPFYLLAHYSIANGRWQEAEWFAERALRLAPPPHVMANLLEWLAMVDFQLRGDTKGARHKLLKAIELAPDKRHLQRNLDELERVAAASPAPLSGNWQVERDAEPRATDLQPIAA